MDKGWTLDIGKLIIDKIKIDVPLSLSSNALWWNVIYILIENEY